MAQKLDQIIVLDLEATCWEGDPPPGQKREIIEIGLCLLDVTSGERYKKRSYLVRPEQSSVSPFCTQLTTLTAEQVSQGLSFGEAIKQLRDEFSPAERTWASYGDYDRIQLQKQCAERGVLYPFNRSHINVKNLLALGLNLPHEIGLDSALENLGLPLDGTHHRGDDDAWNIAAILNVLLNRIRRETA